MKFAVSLLLLIFALAPLRFARADDAPEVGQEAVPADSAAPSDNTGIVSQTPPEQQHTCYVTGEPWEPSPQRVEVIFREFGKPVRARFLNLGYFVYALRTFDKAGRALSVEKVSIVDYPTFGTPNEHMIEVDRDKQNAWFVFTDQKVKGANAPYVFSFDSESAAKDFVKKNGGRVQDYASVLTKLARAMANTEKGKAKPDDFGNQLMSN